MTWRCPGNLGRVNQELEAIVPVEIQTAGGSTLRIDAAIDTGSNGYLSSPPKLSDQMRLELHSYAQAVLADDVIVTLARHAVRVLWFGKPKDLIAYGPMAFPWSERCCCPAIRLRST
jgi:predicted aspartyl protease